VEIKDVGSLRPFSEISLLAQILPYFEKITNTCVLVFSKEEVAQMDVLSNQVIGGLQTDQGLGRTQQGANLLLGTLLKYEGMFCSYIPTDGDLSKPFTQVTEWAFAIVRPAH